MDNRAIGVFDSGLGGLTATHELMKLMPDENIIYLGDSHNMPYGERSHEEIVRLSRWDLSFLLERKVKAVFVACGTATSNALDVLKKESPVPVIGVVEPAVKEAVTATRNKKIGLLATRACVQSGAFQRALANASGELEITVQACPKFASMVEEGIIDKNDERVRQAVSEYLPLLKSAGGGTVILGCTHYPMLSDVISEYMGSGVTLISSSAAAARSVKCMLVARGMTAEKGNGGISYNTTGDEEAFAASARLMLKNDISSQLTRIEPLIL